MVDTMEKNERSGSSVVHKLRKSSKNKTHSVNEESVETCVKSEGCIVIRVYPDCTLTTAQRKMIQRLGQLQYGVLGRRLDQEEIQETITNNIL